MTANDYPPHTPTVRDVPPAPVTLRRPMKRRRSLLERMDESRAVKAGMYVFVALCAFGIGLAFGSWALTVRGG